MIRFSNYISEDAHELIFKPQDDLKEPDYDDIEIFKNSWVKIKLPTPPREDREIDAVIDAVNTATDEQKAEYENCDKDASYYVKKVLRENSLEYDEDVIEYIEDAYKQLNKNNKIGGSGYKSITVCSFVKSKPYNGPKLDNKQNIEALSGADKFGKTDATANIFFAGAIPDTIEKIIEGSSTVKDMAKKANLGISFRGSNEIKTSSIFIKN